MKRSAPGFLRAPLLPVFLIIIAGFLPYSNTLRASFVFDDEPNIVLNTAIRTLSNFLPDGIGWKQYPTRFIGGLSFAVNYRIHGLDVTGYHLANIAIHVGNALLVYALACLVLQVPRFRKGEEVTSLSKGLPLLSALLFAVHPVQTQAVSYVVQRFASLATLFYLGSIVAYAKGRLAKRERQGAERGSPVSWYLLSWSCALLAMKTKEIAFTLPAVMALFEGFFFEGEWRKRLVLLLPYFLIVMVIPLSLIRMDQPLGGILSDVSERTHVQTHLSRGEYLLTEFCVVATYLRLLFLPVNQNLDYDFPVHGRFLDPAVLLSLLLIVLLLGAALLLFLKSRKESNGRMRLAAFGIFWFFTTLSVESSVIPIVDVIFEHRMYLPSVGAFLAIAALASLVHGYIPLKNKTIWAGVLSGMIVLGLASGSYARNRVWRDNLSIWTDTVMKSPGKARPHYNLGVAYEKNGNGYEAMGHYHAALNFQQKYPEAQNNLGVLFAKIGLIDNAIRLFEAAIQLEPNDVDYHANLARAYFLKGWPEKAMEQKILADRLKNPAR